MAGLVDVELLFARQAIQKFLIGLLQRRVTLPMIADSCPREIVTRTTSRMNLRMVENEAWQTPLR